MVIRMNHTPPFNQGSSQPSQPQAGLNPQEQLTRDQIRLWLVSRVARAVGTSPENIDVNKPFDFYGLDSVQAMQISCDLEKWIGKPLSPTLVWDYPSVEHVADFLAPTNPAPDGHRPLLSRG